MRADKRCKINFLCQPSLKNSYGEEVGEWLEFETGIWASKEPILGNEYFAAETVNSKVEVKFRSQYINGVTNEMIIKHGTEMYEILSAINVKSLNRELLCYCKKVS